VPSFEEVHFTMRYLLAFCLLNALNSLGQQQSYWERVPDRARDSVYFTLPINQYWYNQPWRDSVYRFPEFRQGRFEFANGFSPSTTLNMNYNIFLETIDTKDSAGQVRRVGKFPEIKFIWIGDRKFYNHPNFSYLEIILEGTISVAVRTQMAVGVESRAYSNYVYSPLGVDYRTGAEPETRRYYPVETVYIVDMDDKVHRVGSLLLPSLFPTIKYKIKAFADANKIDYRNKSDILKIVKFCNDNYVAPAQKSVVRRTLRVPHNTDLKNSAWRDSIYRFHEFDDALIRYTEGPVDASRRLNFDFTTGWFKTINYKGDTIPLAPPHRVVTVNIDGVIFMNDGIEGPVEVRKQGIVGLGVKKRIVPKDEFVVKQADEAYSISREKVYEIERSYFFIKKNRAFAATPKMLITLLPKFKRQIAEYLVANNLDLDNSADIIKLLSYCERL
jgi:hypothetical protein